MARSFVGRRLLTDPAMRVLYFSESYSGHDHRFVSSIASAGHEVYYARLYNTPVDLSPLKNVEGVHLVKIKGIDRRITPFSYFRFVRDFRKLVWKLSPDVIHAGPVDKCGSIAAFSGYHPLVVMSWGYDLMKTALESRIWNLLAKYALRSADQFTSDAIVTRDQAIRFGMDEAKCTTFPWGVDLTHFSPGTRTPGTDPTITLFCNRSWEENYGVEVLARAFVRVAERNDQVRLLLLGSGSMETRIKNILEQGGDSSKVEFPGRIAQAQLPDYYHLADIYITPSHVDGTSVSLMEAMACGLPVIASDIPGNVDWVVEEKNGWLFKDGDDTGLADKIEFAIQNRSKLALLGKESRAAAERRADWKVNVKVLFDTYQRAIAERERDGR